MSSIQRYSSDLYHFQGLWLDQKLGEGVYGSVYRVFDTCSCRQLALKVFSEHEDCREESEVLRKITRDGVMHVPRLFFTMACKSERKPHEKGLYTIGMSLIEFSPKACQKSIVSKIISIAKQILEALRDLHEIGLIHADLKPANILFDGYRATLIDFSLTQKKDALEKNSYVQTRYYRAPEIIFGQPYDETIDLWSLGATLFEYYTGFPLCPANGESEEGTKHLIGWLLCHFPSALNDYCRQISVPLMPREYHVQNFLSWHQEIQREAASRKKPEEAEQLIKLLTPMFRFSKRPGAKELLKHELFQREISISVSVAKTPLQNPGRPRHWLQIYSSDTKTCYFSGCIEKEVRCLHVPKTEELCRIFYAFDHEWRALGCQARSHLAHHAKISILFEDNVPKISVINPPIEGLEADGGGAASCNREPSTESKTEL